MFRVVEVRDACVEHIHAVRSGRDKHEFNVYVWDDHGDMWITAPDDEEDGAT